VELERVEGPAGLDHLVSPVKVDREDRPDHLVHLVAVDNQDRPAHRASLASWVLQGSSLDHKDGREDQAGRASLVPLAAQVRRAELDSRGPRARLVPRAHKAVLVSVCCIAVQYVKLVV